MACVDNVCWPGGLDIPSVPDSDSVSGIELALNRGRRFEKLPTLSKREGSPF